MSASIRRLEAAGVALRDALTKHDWVAIGELDVQCRVAVDAAMIDSDNEDELRTSLEALVSLYRDLVTACRSEQQRLTSELVQLNQASQGAKVYQLFG